MKAHHAPLNVFPQINRLHRRLDRRRRCLNLSSVWASDVLVLRRTGIFGAKISTLAASSIYLSNIGRAHCYGTEASRNDFAENLKRLALRQHRIPLFLRAASSTNGSAGAVRHV